MLESIIPLLQFLYWPSYWVAVFLGGFLALLALYFGSTVMLRGRAAPAPVSRLVCVSGWITFAALAVVLTPAVSFFSFVMFEGVTDFVRNPETYRTEVSILRGTRTLAGDAGYARFLGESLVFAGLIGRGVCFAIMMWPSPPRRENTVLRAVLAQRTPNYDPHNGSTPRG